MLGRCDGVISTMPILWQQMYKDLDSIRTASSDTKFTAEKGGVSSTDETELITPTKKILMTANSGSEAARRNGTRAANNRERLRDSMCDLFASRLETIKLKCNALLQLLDRENERWFCENLLEVYIRFSNQLSEHEECMIGKSSRQGELSEKETANVVQSVCENLFKMDLVLHQQMQLVTVAKLEQLQHESYELFLVALQVQNVSRLLSVVSFVGLSDHTGFSQHFNVSHNFFQLLERESNQIENDIRRIVLILIILESFFDYMPSFVSHLDFARSAFDFCIRQRRLTAHLRNFTELFVFSRCNNILDCFKSTALWSVKQSVAGDDSDEFKNLDREISHPLFVQRIFIPHSEHAISKSISSPIVPGNQETKYWFFKLHTDLLPIVNCVSKSVAKNAIAFSIQESDQILNEQSHELLLDFEEKYFEICFVKCQHYVDLNCKNLIQSLAALNTAGSVIERGTEYCANAALQLCFDALGEAVKTHLRNRSRLQKNKNQPVVRLAAPAVLTSPFIHTNTSSSLSSSSLPVFSRKTIGEFCLEMELSIELVEESYRDVYCSDVTECIFFLSQHVARDELEALKWSHDKYRNIYTNVQAFFIE